MLALQPESIPKYGLMSDWVVYNCTAHLTVCLWKERLCYMVPVDPDYVLKNSGSNEIQT